MATNVLIVEDNEDLRELFAEILQDAGFTAVAVSTAGEAVRALEDGVPGLILLDLNLGAEGDVDLLSHLHGTPPLAAVPVVLLSGAHDLEERTKAVGATDFLRKPIGPDDLVAVAARHCRR